ncbi:cell filamentation protein [Pseudobutyrivibrio sp. 49]|uniref:Fic/DOC family protein n=1 Tax=unclassified Pseudobutyrivibrio TaxID=2638619 RepID=UPI00087ECDB9|nr:MULTISPECIES: Fic family protein [unclassified Pseudobutyrivibrio]SDI39713.1 cell filamentation protein [Pseudobutyrivibrio sp. 49]SFO06144.1 cell filamentation protein [Pseudobutyrivibrio sp. UC1225]
MMDEYYRYEYEDNGQYCYPHTHILKNKLDIHDKDELFKVEQELSSARYFELVKHPIPGDFSLDHLCAIHRYLFQDIYDWAGKIRTVDISKGTIFCLTQFIEIEFKKVQEWLINNEYLQDVHDKEVMAKRLAYLIGEINMIHPFREGNGRAQRVYIEYVCKNSKTFDIDFSKTTKNDMILASKESAVLNYEPFEELLYICLVEM